MKKALEFIEEIKEQYKAYYKAKSPKAKEDRAKCIKTMKKDLKDYCKFKGIDYTALEKERMRT